MGYEVAKIENGYFNSLIKIWDENINGFKHVGNSSHNYAYKAKFYFDLRITCISRGTYNVDISNIENAIGYKEYHGCMSADMRKIGFDGYEYSKSTLYITIGGITTPIKNFYTSREFEVDSPSRPTKHFYMKKNISFNFQSDEKMFSNVTIKIQTDEKLNAWILTPERWGSGEWGDLCDVYYEETLPLTSCNQIPTISDYDHDLGAKNNAFNIDYTVWDDDGDKLCVAQKLNTSVIGTYSNVSSGTSSRIYITDDMLKRLPLNQRQYIYIYVDDGKGGQVTRTLTFTRTNATPTISSYDLDLGDKNVGFDIDYTVSDADSDNLTITETLNGQVIRTIPNIKGSASEKLTINNDQLYKTPLNQKSTLIITVDDGKGGVSRRTYTFTRTNTPVAIGIIKKTYPTITFRCTDSNPSGYVTRADIYINNNYITAFTSGFNSELQYNIDFSYLNEGNNTLMIRATNNQNITSDKILNIHKKSLKEPEIGTSVIVKGKKYQIINKKNDGTNMTLVLNKPLQDDVSTTDRIEILNDYCKVFAKTDENNNYEEMQFIKSKDLGNGYTQERYQLDTIGKKITTRVQMYGNTAIKEIKEAFQYLED